MIATEVCFIVKALRKMTEPQEYEAKNVKLASG